MREKACLCCMQNVINRAEGFAWDGAICFLSDFFREAEVCFLSLLLKQQMILFGEKWSDSVSRTTQMWCILLIFTALEGMNSYLAGCKAVWTVLRLGKSFCQSDIAIAASRAFFLVALRQPAPIASAEAICCSGPGSHFIFVGSLATWHLLASRVFTFS